MKQQNLDHKVQQAFNKMSDSDAAIAQERKEAVWKNLATNQSEPKSEKRKSRWWIWFLLGTLFTIAGLGLKEIAFTSDIIPDTEKTSRVLMADVNDQIEVLQNELRLSKSSQFLSKEKLDSIQIENQKLQNELLAMSTKASSNRQVTNTMNYVTDTVYISKLETQELIVERIIRDTVFIELPLQLKPQDAIAKIVEDKNNESAKIEKDIANSKRPSSIQFNFNETDID